MKKVLAIAGLFFGSLAPVPTALAQEGEPVDWMAKYRLAEADGRCAAWTLEQARENGINCWLVASSKPNVTFYIRVNDWHRPSGGITILPSGRQNHRTIEVWVRGYHLNDKSVSYRWSSSLYRFECQRGVYRFAVDQFLTHDADDRILSRTVRKPSLEVATPGSIEEELAMVACE